MSQDSNIAAISIKLWGEFDVIAQNGESLAPRGLKSKLLIVALIFSSDWRQSRGYLAHLLWRDRQTAQALGSLRQSLNEIRNTFGLCAASLKSDRKHVWLDTRLCESDLSSPITHSELLGNLLPKEPHLQTWLRRTREIHQREVAERKKAPFLVIRNHDEDFHSSIVSGGLADTLTDWCAQRIFHVSSSDDDSAARFVLDNLNADSTAGITTRLSLRSNFPPQQVWASNAALPADPEKLIEQHGVHRLINRAVDRTIFEIGSNATGEEAFVLESGALGAIRLIFRNQEGDLEAARTQLNATYENCNRGIYLAWTAYILTFYKAERNHQDLAALRDEARELVARALELEPHSAMVQALCSYVTSYLIGDKSSGFILGTRAIETNRSNPLAWIFRGAANFYGGDPEQSYRDISFARAIAGDGPYRYVVDFYGCIAATLTNRLSEAEELGKISSTLSPTFKGPLRYLAMLHAAKGDHEGLETIVARIRETEPNFELEMLAEASYPVQALRRSEHLMDFISQR